MSLAETAKLQKEKRGIKASRPEQARLLASISEYRTELRTGLTLRLPRHF